MSASDCVKNVSENLAIRPATMEDAPAISTLVNYAYRGGKAAKSWTSEEGIISGPRTSVASVQELIAAENHTILLAVNSPAGKIDGCVYVEKKGTDGYIGMLSVDPDSQQSGVGSKLLAAAERHLQTAFESRAALMTVLSVRTELLNWYYARGYSETGETIDFPEVDAEVGSPLKQNLFFKVLRKEFTEVDKQ